MPGAPPDPRPGAKGIAAARVQRRLAAIVAADVAGYSRLMQRDEDGNYARLKRLRQEVIEPALASRDGRILDLRGNGDMVEFRSVEAAVEIQRALRDREAELPEAERIRLRIGINLGEVIVDGGATSGDGVNVAARVACLCGPGGVRPTRAVRNEVQGKLDLTLAPVGLDRVKNLGEAVEVFRVAVVCAAIHALGAGSWGWAGRSQPQQKPRAGSSATPTSWRAGPRKPCGRLPASGSEPQPRQSGGRGDRAGGPQPDGGGQRRSSAALARCEARKRQD